MAALVRVPAQRQFDQGVPRGPRQEGPGMISGSDEEVDGLLHHVDLAAIRAELVPSLEEFPPTLEHRKVAVRWRVVVSALPVGQGVVGRGLLE